MANTVPATVPKPEQGVLLSGQSLDSTPVKKLFEASNYAMAYNGTGTPRISQMFPRRGNTTLTGEVLYTSGFDRQVASWMIPDTRGATSVACYAYGSSVSGGGKVGFRSRIENDFSGMQNLPATPGLIGPYVIDIDTSGGYEEIELLLSAVGGDVTLDSILVYVEPLADPLPSGADSIGCVAFDEDEYNSDEPLASDSGRKLRTNLVALRTIPHVYYNWSGITNIANSTAEVMVGLNHTIPAIVWPDTENNADWELTVWVKTRNNGADDTYTVINIGHGAIPSAFDKKVVITSTAGEGDQWHDAVIKLPNHHKMIRGCGNSLESVSISIWPTPVSDNGVRDYREKYYGTEDQLSTSDILSIAIWGV